MIDEWVEVRLGDIADVNPEPTPKWTPDHEITYVDIASVSSDTGISNDLERYRFGDAPGRARRRVRAGDVLVSTVRPNLRAFAMVPQHLDGEVASTGFAVLRARPQALPGFVWSLVQSDRFVSEMVARCSGSNYPAIRADDVAAFPVALPPLAVQYRIVDLLAHLANLATILRSEQSTLDDAWWALAREVEVTASQYESTTLGEIAEIVGGITKNKKTVLRGEVVEVPYLRVANVHRRYLNLSQMSTIRTTVDVVDRLRLQPGDVLMNEGGDKDKLGRGAVWRGQIQDCVHQNHVFRARITDPRFIPEFVSAWSNSFGQSWFEVFGTQTTGIASVSKSTLSKFPIPCLDIKEQARWANALQSLVDAMDNLAREEAELGGLHRVLLNGLLNRSIEIPDAYDSLLEAVA